MTCVVCAGSLRKLGRRGSSTYAYCRRCGSVQLTPMPGVEEIRRLYKHHYHKAGHYNPDPEEHRKERWRVCRQVSRLVAEVHGPDQDRMVVDVGAGWGTLGLALRDLGIPYMALDLSRAMVDHMTKKGLTALQGDIDLLERDPSLAGRVKTFVTMAVHEHLPDQTEILRRLAALVPSDGGIVIQCPTAGIARIGGRILRAIAPARELPSFFGSLTPPWHVCLPTIESIRIQAGQCGLDVQVAVPSRSGRTRDWRRLLQTINEWVAFGGYFLVGERWPLSMGGVFSLRPRSGCGAGQ